MKLTIQQLKIVAEKYPKMTFVHFVEEVKKGNIKLENK